MEKRAVVAIVNFNGKILVGKKRSDSPKVFAGLWHLPGETTQGEETDEEAIRRGLLEEAGIDVQVGKYIGEHFTPTHERAVRFYECFADSDTIRCGSDLEDIQWIPRSEVVSFLDEKILSFWPREVLDYFSK